MDFQTSPLSNISPGPILTKFLSNSRFAQEDLPMSALGRLLGSSNLNIEHL